MSERKRRNLGWLGLGLLVLAALLFTVCSSGEDVTAPTTDGDVSVPVEEQEPVEDPVEEWTENTYEDTGQVDELLVDDPATYDTTDLGGSLPHTGWEDGGLFALAVAMLLSGGLMIVWTEA